MAGLGKQTRGTGIAKIQRQEFKKGGKAFPDLTGDGKVTFKDVLKGRGVIKKKGGMIKKADMMTAKMPEKKKGKMMKGKR
jgi:hypothetical protein